MTLMPRLLRQMPRLLSTLAVPSCRLPRETAVATDAESADEAGGCGWFDSSHALRAGLTVFEQRAGSDADGAAEAQVELLHWLSVQVGGEPTDRQWAILGDRLIPRRCQELKHGGHTQAHMHTPCKQEHGR